MTDVHGAEFTYIIVSNRAGKRIFITRGGGTDCPPRSDVLSADREEEPGFSFAASVPSPQDAAGSHFCSSGDVTFRKWM